MTNSHLMRDRPVMMSSTIPSTKYSWSGSPLMFSKGKTPMEGLSGRASRAEGLSAPRARVCRGLRLRRLADFERIDADRLGDVLELGRPEVADLEIESRLHLAVRVLGKADRTGLRDAFQPRGDIDAVAHEVAVALLHHVADMDADAELDAPVLWHADIALDEAALHFDRAAHRVDDAAELDDRAVACALDDAAAMGGDGRIDQIAAESPEPRKSRSSSAPASRL